MVARGGGQNKRGRKGRGRPAGYTSPAEAVGHIKRLVRDAPLYVDQSVEEVTYVSDQTASLQCLLCCGVVNQPVELACSNLVCASCCCNWIKVSGQVHK